MLKGAVVVKTHQVSNSSKVGHGIELTLVVNQFFSSIILVQGAQSYRIRRQNTLHLSSMGKPFSAFNYWKIFLTL